MAFEEAFRRLGIQLLRDEPLAKHTTFRIGGPAEWYAAATTLEQLEALPDLALEHGLPLTILGGGSNLLVSDAGIRGLVVANQTRWHGTGAEFRQRWDHPADAGPAARRRIGCPRSPGWPAGRFARG